MIHMNVKILHVKLDIVPWIQNDIEGKYAPKR